MTATRLTRLLAAVAVAVAAATAAVATGAWACFPLPVLSVQPRASGPVGAQMTVEGVDFGEGVGTEVRWNALDGPLLGRGPNDRFRVPVTIPAAEDGTYVIVALSRRVDGSVGVKAAAAFQVESNLPTGPAPPAADRAADGDAAPGPTKLSTAAIAGLALTGGALFTVGGVAGACLARRKRAPSKKPPAGTDTAG